MYMEMIRELRYKALLTQEEMAAALGMTREHYCRCENRDDYVFPVKYWPILAQVLEVDRCDLFEWSLRTLEEMIPDY